MYEADCPREYKELYAQKKIALDNYLSAYNKLVASYYDANGNLLPKPTISLEATFDLSDLALKSFTENQLIYDEFNYYQDTGKVLGVHPVFRVLKLTESIKKMREAKAVNRLRNLQLYMNRTNRKLDKMDADKKAVALEKLTLWQEEIELIKSLKNLE